MRSGGPGPTSRIWTCVRRDREGPGSAWARPRAGDDAPFGDETRTPAAGSATLSTPIRASVDPEGLVDPPPCMTLSTPVRASLLPEGLVDPPPCTTLSTPIRAPLLPEGLVDPPPCTTLSTPVRAPMDPEGLVDAGGRMSVSCWKGPFSRLARTPLRVEGSLERDRRFRSRSSWHAAGRHEHRAVVAHHDPFGTPSRLERRDHVRAKRRPQVFGHDAQEVPNELAEANCESLSRSCVKDVVMGVDLEDRAPRFLGASVCSRPQQWRRLEV